MVTPPATQSFDVIIIGAGLSGLSSLYHIKQRFPSYKVRVFDTAPDVGGTWFWNCYPGCRIDSESISYGLSFDKELLNDWNWKETFSAQPDTHAYISYFADKHNLRQHIQLNTLIQSATWSEENSKWTIEDENLERYSSTYLITCIGVLSAPTLPAIPGIEDFQNLIFHTSRWPRELDISDFAGKRVGIIGTGATGIQTITEVAKEPVKSLTVFQRTANWSAPLRNEKISPDRMSQIKKEYDDIWRRCAETPTGFIHSPDPRKTHDVSEMDRVALYEKLYSEPFGDSSLV